MGRPTLTCVLAPLDGSPGSARALQQAAALARTHDAELRLLHLTPRTPAADLDARQYGALLRSLRDTARDLPVEPRRSSVAVAEGDPASEILRDASSIGADLVVLPAPGDDTADHRLVSRVIMRAPCPVLIVPADDHAPAAPPFARIVCAVGMGPFSAAPITAALSLGQEAQGHVTIVHVIGKAGRESVDRAIRTIEGVVPREALAWCEVGAIVSSGSPAGEVLGVADRARADLIVIGAPRSAGSPIHAVVAGARCPVLVARQTTSTPRRPSAWLPPRSRGAADPALRDPVW